MASKISAAARNASLRQHLVDLITGSNAHVSFDAALKGLPADLRGERPNGSEFSPWQLLEHLRIAQWDILEFSLYCTGDWDEARQREHARQVTLVRP